MVDTGYATRDVARIAGVPESAVRALVRDGVLVPRQGPRGGWLFSMQDVVLLRAAAALRGTLSARRLHHALRMIRAQLPAGRSLTSVQILADGDRVVVQDGRTAWEAATGQGLLALDTPDVAAGLAPLAHVQFRAVRAPGEDLD